MLKETYRKMIRGLVGCKLGMTRLFNADGISIPITMIKIDPHIVTQVKDIQQDGYSAVQIITGNKSSNRINKAKFGHLKKSGCTGGRNLLEFRLPENHLISVGDIITIEIFKNVKKVDIKGISKGKGFAGTVKRWNFHMQDASHGNSLSHRAPGSIGQNQTPGKVFKGKKMAGQLGNCKITVQNLDVISIDIKRSLLLIKGAVPGVIGGDVFIKQSVKNDIIENM